MINQNLKTTQHNIHASSGIQTCEFTLRTSKDHVRPAAIFIKN
jgi:hypothetical protein